MAEKCVYPEHLVALAQSHQAGEDCLFALHDALIELGHADLAKLHFGGPMVRCRPGSVCSVVLDILMGHRLEPIDTGATAQPHEAHDSPG